MIGAGRGQSEPSREPGTKGTAAGVFSRQAKREGAEPTSTPEEVLAGIREAARQVGERPERLLMVDYQQIAAADPEPPAAARRLRRLRQLEGRAAAGRRVAAVVSDLPRG